MSDVSMGGVIPTGIDRAGRLKKRGREEGLLMGRKVEERPSLKFSDQQIQETMTEIEGLLEKAQLGEGLSSEDSMKVHHHLRQLTEALQPADGPPEKKRVTMGERKHSFETSPETMGRTVLSLQERLDSIKAQVQQADQILKDKMNKKGEEVRQKLLKMCEEAGGSDDPISVLKKGITEAEAFYGEDSRFRPIVRNARLLLSAFAFHHQEAKNLLIPFFRKVFIDDPYFGGIVTLTAHEIAAQLLFLADANKLALLPESFEGACEVLKKQVSEILLEQKRAVEKRISESRKCFVYQSYEIRDAILPQAMAGALVRPDGSVNIGLIPLVKSVFLVKKESRDAMDRHIVSSLRELQSDEALVQALEDFSPPSDPGAIADVNCLLGCHLDAPVSKRDTVHAVLTTLFTWLRQGTLGNCYLVAPESIRKESLALWMIGDIRELLTKKRTLTREMDGESVVSVGLPWPVKEIVTVPMSSRSISPIFSLPHVKYACELLGCTTEKEFRQVAEKVGKANGGRWTLLKVFEELRSTHSEPQEKVLSAIRVTEAPTQNPLLRIWENAMGGFLFPPLTPSHLPIHTFFSRRYFTALVQASLKHAEKLHLTDVAEKLKGALLLSQSPGDTFQRLSPNAVPSSWGLLRGTLIPEGTTDPDSLSFVLMYSDPSSGQLVPFSSFDEVAKFLQNSFEQWVDDLKKQGQVRDNLEAGQRVPSPDFLRNFEETLREKIVINGKPVPALVEKGLSRGVQYYTILGAIEGYNFLERGVIELSRGEIKKFGDTVEQAIPQFLGWLDVFRHQHGQDPSMTVGAGTKDHMFRLLPNHPSLLKWHEKGGDAMSEVVQKTEQILAKKLMKSTQLAKSNDVIRAMASEIISTNGLKISEQVVFDAIQGALKVKLGECSRLTIKAFSKAVLDAVAEINTKYARPAKANFQPGTLIALKYSLLESLSDDFSDLPIHFADTNWETRFSGKREAQHYALWFDPFDCGWMVISLPESGKMISGKEIFLPEIEEPAFFQPISIQRVSESFRRAIKEKRILSGERTRSKKLSQLERQFAEAWGVLRNKIKETPLQERQEMLQDVFSIEIPEDSETSSLDVAKKLSTIAVPHTLFEVVKLCVQLRRAYQKLFSELCCHVEPQPSVIHAMHLMPYATTMHHLLEDDESFFQIVQDLMKTEEMDAI
jgi:hypothetical protein